MTSTPIRSEIVRRRRLYEDVANRIEAMIQDGTLKAGDQLPSERELMQRYGVGRPAVREALFALQKMGLVAVSAGDRARVTRPTAEIVIESLSGAARHLLAAPHGVRSFQDARLFFEVGLARHAAIHASDADVTELMQALEANRQTIGDIPSFERTDVEFHHVLAVIPRNPIFTAIHAAIAEWLVEQRHITLRRPGQNEIAYQAHAAIARAIEARDSDRAERLMRAHLDQVAGVYWDAVEASQ